MAIRERVNNVQLTQLVQDPLGCASPGSKGAISSSGTMTMIQLWSSPTHLRPFVNSPGPPQARRSAFLKAPRYICGHHQPPSQIDVSSSPLRDFGTRITNRQGINDLSGCYGGTACRRVITAFPPARSVDVLRYLYLSLQYASISEGLVRF